VDFPHLCRGFVLKNENDKLFGNRDKGYQDSRVSGKRTEGGRQY